MTARKKRGITLMVSGVASVLAGGFLAFATQSPDWLPLVFSLVGAVGNALGFTFVFPDTDD